MNPVILRTFGLSTFKVNVAPIIVIILYSLLNLFCIKPIVTRLYNDTMNRSDLEYLLMSGKNVVLNINQMNQENEQLNIIANVISVMSNDIRLKEIVIIRYNKIGEKIIISSKFGVFDTNKQEWCFSDNIEINDNIGVISNFKSMNIASKLSAKDIIYKIKSDNANEISQKYTIYNQIKALKLINKDNKDRNIQETRIEIIYSILSPIIMINIFYIILINFIRFNRNVSFIVTLLKSVLFFMIYRTIMMTLYSNILTMGKGLITLVVIIILTFITTILLVMRLDYN